MPLSTTGVRAGGEAASPGTAADSAGRAPGRSSRHRPAYRRYRRGGARRVHEQTDLQRGRGRDCRDPESGNRKNGIVRIH